MILVKPSTHMTPCHHHYLNINAPHATSRVSGIRTKNNHGPSSHRQCWQNWIFHTHRTRFQSLSSRPAERSCRLRGFQLESSSVRCCKENIAWHPDCMGHIRLELWMHLFDQGFLNRCHVKGWWNFRWWTVKIPLEVSKGKGKGSSKSHFLLLDATTTGGIQPPPPPLKSTISSDCHTCATMQSTSWICSTVCWQTAPWHQTHWVNAPVTALSAFQYLAQAGYTRQPAAS